MNVRISMIGVMTDLAFTVSLAIDVIFSLVDELWFRLHVQRFGKYTVDCSIKYVDLSSEWWWVRNGLVASNILAPQAMSIFDFAWNRQRLGRLALLSVESPKVGRYFEELNSTNGTMSVWNRRAQIFFGLLGGGRNWRAIMRIWSCFFCGSGFHAAPIYDVRHRSMST